MPLTFLKIPLYNSESSFHVVLYEFNFCLFVQHRTIIGWALRMSSRSRCLFLPQKTSHLSKKIFWPRFLQDGCLLACIKQSGFHCLMRQKKHFIGIRNRLFSSIGSSSIGWCSKLGSAMQWHSAASLVPGTFVNYMLVRPTSIYFHWRTWNFSC